MDADLVKRAGGLLEALRSKGLTIATAESCTGGLISAYLTEVSGSSAVVDRGFVTYSNAAKTELLGVPAALIETHGAVSEEVVAAMARGALERSPADLSVAVTGIAGPSGGTESKPVGLVHIAAATRDGRLRHVRCAFGEAGRSNVRRDSVKEAFNLVWSLL